MHTNLRDHRPPAISRTFLIGPLALLFVTIVSSSQEPAPSHWSLPADLDHDGHVDTVRGTTDYHARVVPVAIRWGGGGETMLSMPSWGMAGAMVAVLDDTGLLISVSGRSPATGADTTACLVLDGPRARLSTTLDLGRYDSSLRPLRIGSELVDPAMRDLSGRFSYRFVPNAINVRQSSPLMSETRIEMRVYPIPAQSMLRISLRHCPAGALVITLHSLHGDLLRRLQPAGSTGSDVVIEVDISDIPTGPYFVRATSDGVNIAQSTINIIR